MENDKASSKPQQQMIEERTKAIIDSLPTDAHVAMAIAATVYKSVLIGFAAETGAKPLTLATEMNARIICNIQETLETMGGGGAS